MACASIGQIQMRRFEGCDLDDGFADMPSGSHRLKDSWIAKRKDWLDDKGRPIPAGWSRSEHARKMEDLVEFDYCLKEKAAEKGYTVKFHHKDINVPESFTRMLG